jgi:IS30 family transposase
MGGARGRVAAGQRACSSPSGKRCGAARCGPGVEGMGTQRPVEAEVDVVVVIGSGEAVAARSGVEVEDELGRVQAALEPVELLRQGPASARAVRRIAVVAVDDCDVEMWVSTETIYQSLYVQSRGALRHDLARCLRTGRALRRPCRQPGQRKNRIPNMINISERPAQAEDRAVPGHWEGDLIIGKGNLTAIGTLVERTTGYTMLLHLPDGYKAEQVRDALAAKIQTLPEQLRASLTWDQGPEMLEWKQVSIDADIEIYFCDPHAPWQRATNENTDGLLRQYFPKGTDLSVHSVADLDAVAEELNDRPRKRLAFSKPIEELGPLLLR